MSDMSGPPLTTVNCDDLEHRVSFLLLYDPIIQDTTACCFPERPCTKHAAVPGWLLLTMCGIEMSISGRPHGGVVTCLACIAK